MTGDDTSFVGSDLHAVRAGSPSATDRLVRRHWNRLAGLVRLRVRWCGRPAVSLDEEDVANSAFKSAIVRLRKGEYLELVTEDGFWQLLARIATRKAGRLVQKWQKRPRVLPLSSQFDTSSSTRSLASRVASAEELERLLDALRVYQPPKSQHPSGGELVRLVNLLGDNCGIAEIADRLGVARCTVHRWLGLVRRIGTEKGIVIQIDESAP
jgi:DNA-directed RNA polymerase specialized sigma24 family protein